MRALRVVCTMLLLATTSCTYGQPLRVCLLTSTGTGGCQEALKGRAEVEVTEVKRIDEDELLTQDVLVVGATTLADPTQVQALKTFVWCGGGLLLHHNACGRNQPETLFPEIASKVAGGSDDTLLIRTTADHPVTAGLPPQFAHAYFDHMTLVPGAKGTVLARDRAGQPVVVAGEYGHGRVVLCGNAAGYWADPADLRQAEKPPEGGELKLLENAIRWAGATRASALAQGERENRRAHIRSEMTLEAARRSMPTSDWFGPEMLRGVYLPGRPVAELGGRYFITYDHFCWRGYRMRRALTPEDKAFFRERMRIDVKRLKWLGVTDVIYWVDVHGERVAHKTAVPDCHEEYRDVDPLMELVDLAHEEGGLKVWAAWHSCGGSGFEKYAARDAAGKPYLYGGKATCEDLLSPAYRERVHRLIGDYDRYRKHGNFEGIITYDEIFFLYADFHGDDLDRFAAFCKENFGESPPADMPARLARGTGWKDPDDVVRRRYILFKNWVVTDFYKDYVAYAHRQGLKVGIELRATAQYPSGWCWGMDNVALTRLGADFHVVSPQKVPTSVYPNTLLWLHVGMPWGFFNTHCLNGGPGGACFTFNQLWRPLVYAKNPHYTRELAKHIRTQREWANPERLARVAVLHNQTALQMLHADPTERWVADQAAMHALASRQDVDMIFVQASELYKNYRVLMALPDEVRGLSAEVLGRLREFIANGGVVVSLGATWSTARADLTQEQDQTVEFVGVTYGAPVASGAVAFQAAGRTMELSPAARPRRAAVGAGTKILATFSDGTPAVTEKPIGKGKVVGVHFDAAAQVHKEPGGTLADYLRMLVEEASSPPIRVESPTVRAISTLKKGNWVLVALYSEQIPARATVRLNVSDLGLRSEHGFQVHMLAKEMEILPPGSQWGDDGFWTAAQLARGVEVTLPQDNDAIRPLPGKLDLSAFNKEDAAYIEAVIAEWSSPVRGEARRRYEHEILVIGPADELFVADTPRAPPRP
jgi:hypothetical protein